MASMSVKLLCGLSQLQLENTRHCLYDNTCGNS